MVDEGLYKNPFLSSDAAVTPVTALGRKRAPPVATTTTRTTPLSNVTIIRVCVCVSMRKKRARAISCTLSFFRFPFEETYLSLSLSSSISPVVHQHQQVLAALARPPSSRSFFASGFCLVPDKPGGKITVKSHSIVMLTPIELKTITKCIIHLTFLIGSMSTDNSSQ